jgi:glycosyltransferase involved in cell wall biosynthesis
MDSSSHLSPSAFVKHQDRRRILKRPKLLFLARPFPPLRTIASVRTWNMANYLSRSGWNVTVVTPHPSLWRRVENPEKIALELKQQGIKTLFTDHEWRCLSPRGLKCWNQGLGWVAGGVCRRLAQRLVIDRAIGWIKPAERACSHLTPDDVDVILATAPPFSAFILARRLSERLERPYVLDYRDLWSKNMHDPLPAVAKREAKLLAGCAGLTTVSPSWGSIMEMEFGVGLKLNVVPNGYHPEELRKVKPYNFGHFAIVYTGNFYPPKRVISPLMAAFKRLKEATNGKDRKWVFHYYGSQENHVREQAKRFNVTEQLILHGRVPWAEALSAVRGADLSVVITSIDDEGTLEEKGMIPAKLFEALGMGTSVLLISPIDSDARKIAASTGMTGSFTGNQTDKIASFLADAMRGGASELRNGEIYSWTNVVSKMDSVLRAALK